MMTPDSNKLTPAERSAIVVLSEQARNCRELCAAVGVGCIETIDAVMAGRRSVRASTIAKVRRRLRELEATRGIVTLPGVH